MLDDLWFCMKMWTRFRTYQPYPVTPRSVLKWLYQFNYVERRALRKAAIRLSFVTEKVFARDMLDRNSALLKKLKTSGVQLSNIIYVSIGDAGSSSHAVLNLIRDQALLQSLGCRLVDGRSYDAIHKITDSLGQGVIIYGDDFAGTGEQFCLEQEQLSNYVVGNFAHYYLVHTACEEAMLKIDGNGVVPWQHAIHAKNVRPLHENSTILTAEERACLTQLCLKIGKSKKGSLGYGDLATSIVFYKNTPDNVPRIFRGDSSQKSFRGLVPRTTDLPKPRFA